MKAKIVVSISFSLLALLSCKKDKVAISTSGSTSATINGENWSINTVKG